MAVTNIKKTVKNKKAQASSTSNKTAEQNLIKLQLKAATLFQRHDCSTVPNPPFSAAANHVLNQLQGLLKTKHKPHLSLIDW